MRQRITALAGIAALAIATTGCATKKFVRQSNDPLQARLGELEKRNSQNTASIESLDEKTQRGIARVDEKAGAADARATEAGQKAGQAGSRADQAGSRAGQAIDKADGARTLAESGLARTGRLETVVESLDNFQMTSAKTVYFGFDKSELKDEDRQELDQIAGSLTGAPRYIIEVQGFTDSIGPSDYNYALSERRANAVVRYLATRHNLPVYRIHTLAMGKDQPVSPEKTAEARKMNRRVEVKLYLPKFWEAARQTASPSN